MIQSVLNAVGRWLAGYLNKPIKGYQPFAITDPAKLAAVLRPCDVLLVEGDRRISTAIKYLTQSTWSHSALYVGDALGPIEDFKTSPTLVEADIKQGVIAVPLGKYASYNTRICRPLNLTPEDQQRVVKYIVDRLGFAYDLKNVFDLARYLLPTPPVPSFMRRRMLALGSGDPTRAICSSLIAQAFQSVRYPILPQVEELDEPTRNRYGQYVREILHIRHYSLFAPRDFDISPYFQVVKPTIEHSFDYKKIVWGNGTRAAADRVDSNRWSAATKTKSV